MTYRKIESIFRNDDAHWVGNGFYVKQYFPEKKGKEFMDRFSPFLLLDYNAPHFFKQTAFETGVGPHPHRGFETVTFAFAGKVEHGDNRGNHGVIEPGDMQWMTAGEGILHKEYHEKEYAKKDRVFHMIQLWVNLPQKDKMTSPKYQSVKAAEMGRITDDDVNVIVYAGEVKGAKGPASTFSPMNIYKVELENKAAMEFCEPADFNTGFLVLAGDVEVNDKQPAKEGDFVLFENDGGDFKIRGTSEHAEVFVLSGRPLNEPIAAMGPFVMNTMEEIRQANADYIGGKFGSHDF